jgi:hypothetical protein
LELERVAGEQSEIQKNLETQRKQFRQHQVVVQEYFGKKVSTVSLQYSP